MEKENKNQPIRAHSHDVTTFAATLIFILTQAMGSRAKNLSVHMETSISDFYYDTGLNCVRSLLTQSLTHRVNGPSIKELGSD